MKKLFTKSLFAANPSDQCQIVASRLRDLAQAVPYDDTGRVRAMIRRIEKKAVERGIYSKSEAQHD